MTKDLKFEQKAKEFALSKGYDIVRFVMVDNGHEIYNFISKTMIGKKTGWPHFMDIDTNGTVIEVEEEERIFYYKRVFCGNLKNNGNNI